MGSVSGQCMYCPGTSITLNGSAMGTPPYTYQWICNNGFISSSQNPSISPVGDVSCELTIIDAAGCVVVSNVELQDYDIPSAVIGITGCTIDFIFYNQNQSCTWVLEEFDAGTWKVVATSLPFVTTKNTQYRVRLNCICGVYYSNVVASTTCGPSCSNNLGLSCNFNSGTNCLSVTSTGTSSDPIVSDVITWQKINPNTGAVVASGTYTGPLCGCAISETFTVNWRQCELGPSGFSVNLGFTSVSGCNGSSTSQTCLNWGAANFCLGPQTSYSDNWFWSDIATFSPYGFQLTYNTPLGPMNASATWVWSGPPPSGPPINCNNLIFSSTPAPPKYYNIRFVRTVTFQNCPQQTFETTCNLGGCNAVNVTTFYSGGAINAVASGCGPNPVTYTFTNTTTGVVFQSGPSNVLQNPPNGSYLVQISCGGCTASQVIVVNNTCLVFANASASGCLLTASITNCAPCSPTIQWYRNGTLIPGATSLTYQATLDGNYYAIVNCPCACSVPITTNTVTLNGCACNPDVTLFTNPACQINSVVTGCQGTPSYQWSTGATTSSITVPTNGTYSVTVTGCCQSPIVRSISVTGCTPVPNCNGFNAFINAPATICLGDNWIVTPFVTGGVGPYTYQWSINGNPITTNTNLVVISNNYGLGPVNILLRVEDSQGCVVFRSTTVNITNCQLPCTLMVDAVPDNPTVCFGEVVQFTTNQSGGTSPFNYNWKVNNVTVGTASTLNYTFPSIGIYNVLLTVTDNNGCVDTDVVSVSAIECCECVYNSQVVGLGVGGGGETSSVCEIWANGNLIPLNYPYTPSFIVGTGYFYPNLQADLQEWEDDTQGGGTVTISIQAGPFFSTHPIINIAETCNDYQWWRGNSADVPGCETQYNILNGFSGVGDDCENDYDCFVNMDLSYHTDLIPVYDENDQFIQNVGVCNLRVLIYEKSNYTVVLEYAGSPFNQTCTPTNPWEEVAIMNSGLYIFNVCSIETMSIYTGLYRLKAVSSDGCPTVYSNCFYLTGPL